MKEKTTSAKLKNYSSLAVSLIAMGGAADAQVVYTDIVDFVGTLDGDIYKLDLDNDGSTDYVIERKGTFAYDTYEKVEVSPAFTSNGVVGAGTSSADALIYNTGIASSNNWLTANSLLMASNTSNFAKTGPWVSTTDLYLGFKFFISGNIHYGWARLDVNKPCDMFTIKDYAYEKTPKTKINAGDMGNTTGIAQVAGSEAKVWSSGKTITVELKGIAPSAISVKNVLGQEVKALNASESKTEIDMSGLPSGVYFVSVSTGVSAATHKIFIQ